MVIFLCMVTFHKLGFGFISDYLISTDPEVAPLLPQYKVPAMPIWLVVHREIRGNLRLRKVYDFLAKQLSDSAI